MKRALSLSLQHDIGFLAAAKCVCSLDMCLYVVIVSLLLILLLLLLFVVTNGVVVIVVDVVVRWL